MTAQLALRLDAPDPRAYVRVLDAVESLARGRRAEVQARGGVWAPSEWITRGDDVAETERGRFNACVLDAMDRAGLPRISPADLRDATRDLPLWSEAWQRFVAPRDADGIVRCVVSREVTRVDLRVRGVVYLGAALQASGGVHRGVTLDYLATWLAHRRTERIPEHRRERWPLLVWTCHTATHSAGFNAPAGDVEILRMTETT